MDSIKGPTHKTLGLSHLLIPQLDHGHCQFSISFTHKHSHSVAGMHTPDGGESKLFHAL